MGNINPGGSGGGAPTGPAGGTLTGTYPNPSIVTPFGVGQSAPVAEVDILAPAGRDALTIAATTPSPVAGAASAGAAVTITTGTGGNSTGARPGDGGNYVVTGGTGGAAGTARASGAGGAIDITAGNGGDNSHAGGSAGNGGNVNIDVGRPGNASGGASPGSNGTIDIGDNAATVNIGNGSIPTIVQINGQIPATVAAPYLNFNGAAYAPIFPVGIPPASGWTWVQQGSSTLAASNGALTFKFQSSLGQDLIRGYMRSIGASTGYTVIMGISLAATNVGFAISDGTKFVFVWLDPGATIRAFSFNTASSVNAAYFTANTAFSQYAPLFWGRWQDDGAGNRTFSLSADGQNWTVINTQASATFLTETQFGIAFETNTSPSVVATLVDVRVTIP